MSNSNNTQKSQIELLTPSVQLRSSSGRGVLGKNMTFFKKELNTERPGSSAIGNWKNFEKKKKALEFNKRELLSHSPTNTVMIMPKNSRNKKCQLNQISIKAGLSDRRDFHTFINDLSHSRFMKVSLKESKSKY